jgi:4-hydroxy-tetrahydrodipicolinate reductase
MDRPVRVGLLGYGRAGQAVARVLDTTEDIDLRWIAKRCAPTEVERLSAPAPLHAVGKAGFDDLFEREAVDVLVDFSSPRALRAYGRDAARRRIGIVSAISNYSAEHRALAARLAATTAVMVSPNMTFGINFLLVASQMLQHLAPYADIEIIEEHFRDKPETSGTAMRIAGTLNLDSTKVNSIRVGGIVGHHEVVFGFPYQTVRLTHESISREAFGTGAVYAIRQLQGRPPGLYRYDDLIRESMREALSPAEPPAARRKCS